MQQWSSLAGRTSWDVSRWSGGKVTAIARQPEDNTRESRSTYIVAQYTSIEYMHCTYAYTDTFWVDSYYQPGTVLHSSSMAQHQVVPNRCAEAKRVVDIDMGLTA